MDNNLTLETFQIDQPIPLHPCSGWPKAAVHHFDRKQAIAVLAAKEINRPLLVRGEPGCGKTQMARAVAQILKMPLVTLVVNERTETEDLFWHYDALRRLSDANTSEDGVRAEEEYLSAGPLWWALNHTEAKKYRGRQSWQPDMGGTGDKRFYKNGVVLLIDEIDKADRSVPNSLLEALGNYSFQVPYLGKRIEKKGPDPLIIITTNREQELPPAFERRCLVLDMSLPDENKDEFVQLLSERGKALYQDQFQSDEIFTTLAQQVWDKRDQQNKAGSLKKPGQAEYLDHLEAALAIKKYETGITDRETEEILAALTYGKYRG